ncbi:MAG: MraY family glycosyltransferase [Phormidesmis sp.]
MVRLGGVAVFVATLCAIGSAFLWFDFSTVVGGVPSAEIAMVWLLIIGGAGFFLIGFADDLFDLSAVHRLWLQGLIAAVLWIFGLRIDTLFLPGLVPCSLGWWSLPITVLWIAGVVNAINWIDGLDGLAAGVSAIATAVITSLAISTAQPMVALIASALLGSLLGFLVYNYNPAEIFMGDGGSYFLGFMLASLCIVGPQQVDMPMASLLPLLILAVPIGDMTSVIVARLYQRRSPFSADNLHIHHRLLNRELNYKTVVWVMYLLTFASGSLALTFAGVAGYFTLWTGSAVLMGFFIWQLVAQLKNRQVPQSKDSNVVVEKAIW